MPSASRQLVRLNPGPSTAVQPLRSTHRSPKPSHSAHKKGPARLYRQVRALMILCAARDSNPEPAD
jgi:hypothetical protein